MPSALPSQDVRRVSADTAVDRKLGPHTTPTSASRTPISRSPTYTTAPVIKNALTHIVSYLASNAVAGSSSSGRVQTQRGGGHIDGSSPAAESFVSADELFLQAMQAPSATVHATTTAVASALSPPQTCSTAASAITRPLALLAASPHCRRSLEEHLIGGCVLSPLGSLILQVRQRDLLASGPTPYQWTLSSGAKSEGRAKKRLRHRTGNVKQRTSLCESLKASEVAVECSQQLVVMSTNVSLSIPLSQPVLSWPPVQRPHSARVDSDSPRRTAASPISFSSLPLAAGIFPRQSSMALTSPPQPPRRSSVGSAVAAVGCPSRDSAAQQRVLTPPRLPSIVGTTSPARVLQSPVLQSCRVPVSGLLSATEAFPFQPTAIAAAAAAASTPSTSSLPTPTSTPRALAATSASAANGHDLRQEALGFASSSPGRPMAFAALSPRPLSLTIPINSPAAAAAAPLPSIISPSSLSLPPALQALYHALWWIRRGPLPVSLSLMRYTEVDMHALWGILGTRPRTGRDGDDVEGGAMCSAEDAFGENRAILPDSKGFAAKRKSGAHTAVTPPSSPRFNAASIQDGFSLLSPTSTPSVLPSSVTELHVHGRAAEAALTALLPGHPEIRSVRLTHTTLSAAQLRDLARSCPNVTHLSLAMNDRLRSTSFLCPTPSETSSVTTTDTATTTATTSVFTGMQPPQRPPPSSTVSRQPGDGSRSPRLSLLLKGPNLSLQLGEEHSTPASPRPCEVSGLNERRGGIPQPPPTALHAQEASARCQGAPTALSGEGAAVDEGGGSGDSETQNSGSDPGDGTTYSRSTQAPPRQQHASQRRREASQGAMNNSRIDLFAPEEEGETEMWLSLWQAAQTDTAERRQAVFVLRPSDVVLGGASEEVGECRSAKGSWLAVPMQSSSPPSQDLTNVLGGLASGRSGNSAMTAGERESQSFMLVSIASGNDNGTDDAASIDTACQLQPPPISAAAPNAGPPHTPNSQARSVAAALAELKASLGGHSTAALPASKSGAQDAKAVSSFLFAAETKAALPSAASPSHPRRRRSFSRSRRRLSARWSETLVDLDLSYTQVPDEEAARGLPQLQMLRRLSLEGCMQLKQVRWLPSLCYLRELNLSFSSIQGAALYPLGGCAHLLWLKLEGCLSFTSVEQLWRGVEVMGSERPPHVSGQQIAMAATTDAHLLAPRIVRHHTAGGIPAITVLPASAGPSASLDADNDGSDNEDGAAPARTSQTSTPPAGARPARSSTSEGEPESIGDTSAPLLSALRVLVATRTGLSDAGLLSLRHIESLECVVLDRCAAVTDINVAAQLPSLHTVDASYTSVTTHGLSALRRSRTLRQLRLQGCLALTRLPALFVEPTQANVRADGVTNSRDGDCDSGRLSPAAAPGLSVLDVSLCSNLSAGGVEGLVVDAVTLKLQDAAAATNGHRGTAPATVTAAVAERTGGAEKSEGHDALLPPHALPQLRYLLLRSCDAVAQLTALRGFTQVVELDLYHTAIDEVALRDATSLWTALEVLNVASTKVRSLAAWCPSEESEESPTAGDGAVGVSAGPADGSRRPKGSLVASPAVLQSSAVHDAPKLPAFARTLRVLALSNTDVTSDGLRALRHFPGLEVLQLANCRRLTSLSFLLLYEGALEAKGAPQRHQRQQVRRTALRELTVTEAAGLTNTETFPHLVACPGLRFLSLAGCAQVGGGAQASKPAPPRGTSASLFTGHLLPLVDTITSKSMGINDGGGDSDLAVLRSMDALTELNLSRTAVTQDDLRALLMPPPVQVTKTSLATESARTARAATRLNLVSPTLGLPAKTAARASPCVARDGKRGSTDDESRSHSKWVPSSAVPHQHLAPTPLQRIWLRGCRMIDEDGLLAAAAAEAEMKADASATCTPGVPSHRSKTLSLLASVREVHLSRGRFGAAVLGSLLT
ncbi:hypothetical protein ABL78_3338 [Leptomonas seymouri]|uniref:Leucine-rich repeat protein n=1 Tax=Leptomonas seymouri TaxID=5684 RepID=A0A0N0P6U8_LEPSE|nr:hypothetical protein ABL78_3338 [Leptomonas seymouri]|eukprot:KPI87587.1 hypothetical protein ABL78_3338 [Leptomonas seymouri]